MQRTIPLVKALYVAVLLALSSVASAQGPGLARLVPVVRGFVDPARNASGWNNTAVRVEFLCREIDIQSCPDSAAVEGEGAGQEVIGIALDTSGREIRLPIRVNIDRTAPVVRIISAVAQSNGFARVAASVSDALSGIRSVACNGAPAAVSGGSVSCEVPLFDGTTDVAVTATDNAGNTSSAGTQLFQAARTSAIEIVPEKMTLAVATSRPIRLVDSAGRELDRTTWIVEDPVIATVDAASQSIVGVTRGQTTVIGTNAGRVVKASVTVTEPEVPMQPGTTLWSMAPQNGGDRGLLAIPMRGFGADMVFIARPQDDVALLLATTMDGRLLSREHPPLARGEDVKFFMGDNDGGVLLWATSGSRSAIVRTGGPAGGGVWRYDCPSPATRYWAMSPGGTLFLIEKADTRFGFLVGIDARTGATKFRLPVPHVGAVPTGFGPVTIPDDEGAAMMFLTTTPLKEKDGSLLVGLWRVNDEGVSRSTTIAEFPEPDLPLLTLGAVYPDGHDALVAFMQRRFGGRRESDLLVEHVEGEHAWSHTLPAGGVDYVLNEQDEALTSDYHTLVSFDVVTGRVRWTYVAPPDGAVYIQFAAKGGGAVVQITGGDKPGRYRFDERGEMMRLLP